jgi:hypothetical protein
VLVIFEWVVVVASHTGAEARAHDGTTGYQPCTHFEISRPDEQRSTERIQTDGRASLSNFA